MDISFHLQLTGPDVSQWPPVYPISIPVSAYKLYIWSRQTSQNILENKMVVLMLYDFLTEIHRVCGKQLYVMACIIIIIIINGLQIWWNGEF